MVEAKDVAVAIVERRDQRLEVGAVVGELVKDDFRLGFGKGAHRGYVEGWSRGMGVLLASRCWARRRKIIGIKDEDPYRGVYRGKK